MVMGSFINVTPSCSMTLAFLDQETSKKPQPTAPYKMHLVDCIIANKKLKSLPDCCIDELHAEEETSDKSKA